MSRFCDFMHVLVAVQHSPLFSGSRRRGTASSSLGAGRPLPTRLPFTGGALAQPGSPALRLQLTAGLTKAPLRQSAALQGASTRAPAALLPSGPHFLPPEPPPSLGFKECCL